MKVPIRLEDDSVEQCYHDTERLNRNSPRDTPDVFGVCPCEALAIVGFPSQGDMFRRGGRKCPLALKTNSFANPLGRLDQSKGFLEKAPALVSVRLGGSDWKVKK
jgi:hypothetical protein